MSLPAPHLHSPALSTPIEQLQEAREILRCEAEALLEVASRLDGQFPLAIELLHRCRGSVIVTGMGKAGLIGQKIAATLSSTGTRAHVLHPAEALHGDLGCLHEDDVLLALSNSGETEEISRLLPSVQRQGIPIVAITGRKESTLGRQANAVLALGRLPEAGVHGLAPSTSTTAMLAVGDALALVLGRIRGLTPQQFALFHPGGSLGLQLTTVAEVMRQGDELRLAADSATIRTVFTGHRPGRRTGAVILTDSDGRLSGLFTDSDLARLLEQHQEHRLDAPISDVMTRHPLTIGPDALLREAITLLSGRKVSELPVVDADHRPLGLIDITDVIGLLPEEAAE